MYRLFIDPATYSTGWALFENDECVISGTITSENKNIFQRVDDIAEDYFRLVVKFAELFIFVDEVHFENVPRSRTCHIGVHYVIGAIAARLSRRISTLETDVHVSSWQKYAAWDKKKLNALSNKDFVSVRTKVKRALKESFLRDYVTHADSLDELAAVAQGFSWIKTNLIDDKEELGGTA